jgi:hypothetical protein
LSESAFSGTDDSVWNEEAEEESVVSPAPSEVEVADSSGRPAAALCKFLATYDITTKLKTFYTAKTFDCDKIPPNMLMAMWRQLQRTPPRSTDTFDDFLRKCGIASTERVVFVHDGTEFEKLDGKWKDMWRSHLSRQKNKKGAA